MPQRIILQIQPCKARRALNRRYEAPRALLLQICTKQVEVDELAQRDEELQDEICKMEEVSKMEEVTSKGGKRQTCKMHTAFRN